MTRRDRLIQTVLMSCKPKRILVSRSMNMELMKLAMGRNPEAPCIYTNIKNGKPVHMFMGLPVLVKRGINDYKVDFEE